MLVFPSEEGLSGSNLEVLDCLTSHSSRRDGSHYVTPGILLPLLLDHSHHIETSSVN